MDAHLDPDQRTEGNWGLTIQHYFIKFSEGYSWPNKGSSSGVIPRGTEKTRQSLISRPGFKG